MDTKYTLEELLQQANKALVAEGLKTFSTSSLRQYTSNDQLPRPEKEGREARYGDEHVDAMMFLRRSQKLGVSAKAHTALLYAERADPSSACLIDPGAQLGIPPQLNQGRESDQFSPPAVNALPGASPTKNSALRFLDSLGGQVAGAARSSGLGSSLAAGGSSHISKSTMAPYASALAGLVGSAAISAGAGELGISRSAKPLSWSEFEVLPGVRLQIRADVNVASLDEQATLIDSLSEIIKNNTTIR